MNIKSREILIKARELENKIIEYRRWFHKNPEAGLEEHKTAQFITDKLQNLDIKVENNIYSRSDIKIELEKLGEEITPGHDSTAIIGTLKGDKAGKTVLLRSDMDAIKVREAEKPDHIPYKEKFNSINEGLMHACGHDAHMAMLLGAAEILAGMKDKIKGNIKFLFQPDEERGCGAKLVFKAGALIDVDAVFGIHVWSPIESGKIMINTGPVMAAVDNFWITFRKGGGHSSMPHKTNDPLMAAGEMLNLLYKMSDREIDTRDPSLINVEMFHSGSDWGVIPDEARMRGTIRTLDEKVRNKIIKRIKEIGNALAQLYNLEFSFRNLYAYPPTINTEDETLNVHSSAEALFGRDKIISDKPIMSGEDFAYYLQKVPGTFILLGIGNKEKGTHFPHHNPLFDVDENQLFKGTALHIDTALRYLSI